MIKFKQGGVTSQDGKTVDIVVKSLLPNTIRDTLIGATLVGVGIAYLTVTAFKNGSEMFEQAELKALYEAGIISD